MLWSACVYIYAYFCIPVCLPVYANSLLGEQVFFGCVCAYSHFKCLLPECNVSVVVALSRAHFIVIVFDLAWCCLTRLIPCAVFLSATLTFYGRAGKVGIRVGLRVSIFETVNATSSVCKHCPGI